MTFKVGDKVRVKAADKLYGGEVATVASVGHERVELRDDTGDTRVFKPDDLELAAAPVNVAADVQAIRERYERRTELRARFEQSTGGERALIADELNHFCRSQYHNDTDIGTLLAEVARLQARVDAQAEALKPFVAFAEATIQMRVDSEMSMEGDRAIAKANAAVLTVADFMRVLAAPQPPASAAQAADGGAG